MGIYFPWFLGSAPSKGRIISTRLVEEKGRWMDAGKLDSPIPMLSIFADKHTAKYRRSLEIPRGEVEDDFKE